MFGKQCKGQLTIEFLIILVIMLLLFSGISLDLINSSLADAIDIQAGEVIESADFVVTKTVDSIALQGSGAKKTITLRAPTECDFALSPSKIIATCDVGSGSYEKYHGAVIGPNSLPSGVVYSVTTEIIESGKSGTVEIVHT